MAAPTRGAVGVRLRGRENKRLMARRALTDLDQWIGHDQSIQAAE
jgi:hypothetical protein